MNTITLQVITEMIILPITSPQEIHGMPETMIFPIPSRDVPFGVLLKSWREARKRSQLDLALEANVSQRHLSFLESGRAQPSREMILQLAEVLEVPLRERNLLLLAAGFAPHFQERGLDHVEMTTMKRALEMTLQHHEPYPALVVNRQWDTVLWNAAIDRLLGLVGDPERVWSTVDPSGGHNLMRLTFHPQGIQPLVRNWKRTETILLGRLQREITAAPTHAGLRRLFDDLCAMSGTTVPGRAVESTAWLAPVLTLELGNGSVVLRLFSMISTFGSPMDVTADDLRVETFFPGDDFTEAFFRAP